MSDATRRRIEVTVLAIAFGAGSGWGMFVFKQSAMETKLDRIDRRVTALYCAQILNPAVREGCNR